MTESKACLAETPAARGQRRDFSTMSTSSTEIRRERQLAVRTVLSAHPEWADRRIGMLCGVSPRTVGRVRARLVAEGEGIRRADVRIGRDGRARPIDPAAQRERIIAMLAERPEASLRDVARAVGVSPETVRSVRTALAEERERAQMQLPIDFLAWCAARDRAARWAPDHSFTSSDARRPDGRVLRSD